MSKRHMSKSGKNIVTTQLTNKSTIATNNNKTIPLQPNTNVIASQKTNVNTSKLPSNNYVAAQSQSNNVVLPSVSSLPQNNIVSNDDLSFASDINKLLLSSTLDYISKIADSLQTITGILLTAYTSIYLTQAQQFGFTDLPKFIYFIPIGLFLLSLGIGFYSAIKHEVSIGLGSIENALQAFEEVVKKRQVQLIVPALYTLGGLLTSIIIFIKDLHTE